MSGQQQGPEALSVMDRLRTARRLNSGFVDDSVLMVCVIWTRKL